VSVWYFVHVGIDLMSSNEDSRRFGIYGEQMHKSCGRSWEWIGTVISYY
jgi:hypothetical protein